MDSARRHNCRSEVIFFYLDLFYDAVPLEHSQVHFNSPYQFLLTRFEYY